MMPQPLDFKYFYDYLHNAAFKSEHCDRCGRTPSLVGVYFGGGRELNGVCIECLISGAIPVHVPRYVVERLRKSVTAAHQDWSPTHVDAYVAGAVGELSRTPTVPWIQNNDWAICHGDFARYLGEWTPEQMNAEAPDGNGQAWLYSVLPPEDRPEGTDLDDLWESIGANWTSVFVFACLTCSRKIAVIQSY